MRSCQSLSGFLTPNQPVHLPATVSHLFPLPQKFSSKLSSYLMYRKWLWKTGFNDQLPELTLTSIPIQKPSWRPLLGWLLKIFLRCSTGAHILLRVTVATPKPLTFMVWFRDQVTPFRAALDDNGVGVAMGRHRVDPEWEQLLTWRMSPLRHRPGSSYDWRSLGMKSWEGPVRTLPRWMWVPKHGWGVISRFTDILAHSFIEEQNQNTKMHLPGKDRKGFPCPPKIASVLIS